MDPSSQPQGPPSHPAEVSRSGEPPVARPARRARRRVWFWLLMAGLAGSLLLNVVLFSGSRLVGLASADRKVQEEHYSHQRRSSNKVAVISVEGAILESDGFIKRQIDFAAEDSHVKAVVLRVDSPGGTVTASDYLYHYLCELRQSREPEIPIVVSMGGMAASGGYYLSMACGQTPDVIFAEETTWTGSIGVIIPHYDISGLLAKWDVKQDSVASGPFKQMLSPTKSRTEDERRAERDILEVLVDESFSRFKKVIREGRPEFEKKENRRKLDDLATGQIYTARQAKEKGLIDRIGFIEDAIDRAIELARLDKNEVTVVRYKPEPNLASLLLGAQSRSQSFDLAGVLEMTAPRAYYLCTWLPSLDGCQKP